MCVCVCVCVCVCLCVCVCVCAHAHVYILSPWRFVLTEQNNVYIMLMLEIMPAMLCWRWENICGKNLCNHIMDDHGRDLPGSKQLCKRVSIKLAESCVASTLLCWHSYTFCWLLIASYLLLANLESRSASAHKGKCIGKLHNTERGAFVREVRRSVGPGMMVVTETCQLSSPSCIVDALTGETSC